MSGKISHQREKRSEAKKAKKGDWAHQVRGKKQREGGKEGWKKDGKGKTIKGKEEKRGERKKQREKGRKGGKNGEQNEEK